MSSLVVVLVVAPLVGSAIALLGKLLPWPKATSVASVSVLLFHLPVLVLLYRPVSNGAVLAYHMGGWPPPYGIALSFDGLAWISTALIFVISAVVVLASFSHKSSSPRFYFFLLLLIAGMQGVVVTADLFNMFVCFEIVAIAAYVLIAYERTSTALVASVKYLILSTVGILFFLIGVLLVYRDLGTLSFAGLGAAPDSDSMHLALAALCVGIGVRTAFIPFHTWLPEAHAYAPHPVSAILSGVLIKVSFLALLRILIAFRAAYLNELLLWIGAATSVVAVVWALSQTDAKRLLAYHSISQMGYVLAAAGIGTSAGLIASVSHAVNHALFKSLLFLSVGTAVDLRGSRNLYKISPLGRSVPVVAVAFGVGALSIAGVPPFNGYASKQLISAALSGSPAYILIWVTGVGTVASFIKLSRIFGFRRAEPAVCDRRAWPLSVSVVLLALLCVATGVVPHVFGSLYAGLLAPGAAVGGSVFSLAKLLQAVVTMALGVGLFFAATSKAAHRVTDRIRVLAPDTEIVLVFFFAGLLGFGIVAYT